MGKLVALIAVLALVVLISGCLQSAGSEACGNSVCDSGETVDSCPADCAAPPMPTVEGTTENETPPSLPF